MVEHSDGWLFVPAIRNAQPASQNLRYQKLAVEGPFFVGDYLKDALHVPSFIQHGYGYDPLNLASGRIDRRQLQQVRCATINNQDTRFNVIPRDPGFLREKCL